MRTLENRLSAVINASRELAIELYMAYKSYSENEAVVLISRQLKLSVTEARNYYRAGQGFSHRGLGDELLRINASVHAAAAIVGRALNLRTGQKRLKTIAAILRNALPESHRHAVNLVNKVVRSLNAQHGVKKYKSARVASSTIAEDGELHFLSQKHGKDSNELRLVGLSDIDCEVISNAVRSMVHGLPPDVQKKSMSVVLGNAALAALRTRICSSQEFGRIATHFVINEEYMRTHPEYAVCNKGRFYTLDEVNKALATWGESNAGSVMAVDDKGFIAFHNPGRLYNAASRVMLDAQHQGCAGTDCSERSDLQYHHIIPWRVSKETEVVQGAPLCRAKDHPLADNPKFSFTMYREYGISVVEYPNGTYDIGLCVHPGSTILQSLGKKYGYDPLDSQQLRQLRALLIEKVKTIHFAKQAS